MADKQLWQVTPVATDVKNDDGVIIGGQTAGTRYAPLTLIANFVHNLWAAFINAITPLKTSFANGDKFPVVNGSTATAMESSKLLELTAQNALAGNVAPAFDPTRDENHKYLAGDKVAYEGEFYLFVNDHYGTWDAEDVCAVPLTDIIGDYVFDKDLFDNSETVIGYFIDLEGNLSNSTGWRTTNLIDVSRLKFVLTCGNPIACSVAFYDASGVFISGLTWTNVEMHLFNCVSIPSNAVYFRACADYTRFIGSGVAFSEAKLTDYRLDNLESDVRENLFTDILFNDPSVTIGKYINLSGSLVNEAEWRLSDYIDVKLLNSVKVVTNPSVCSVAFYDSSKNFISGISSVVIGLQVLRDLVVPVNAVYFRACTNYVRYDGSSSYIRITLIQKELNDLSEEIDDISDEVSLISKSVDDNLYTRRAFGEGVLVGKYIDLSGSLVNESEWRTFDFFDVDILGYVNVITHQSVCSVAFYDSSKNFISGISRDYIGTTPQVINNIVIPIGAVYCRVCTNYQRDTDGASFVAFKWRTEVDNEIESILHDVIIPNNYASIFHDNFKTSNASWGEIGGSGAWDFDYVSGTLTPNSVGGYYYEDGKSTSLYNVIVLGRDYATDKRVASFAVTLGTDTILCLHNYRTNPSGYEPNESMVEINCSAGKLRIHKNENRKILQYTYAAESNLVISESTKCLVLQKKIKEKLIVEVRDFKTMALLSSVEINDSWVGGTFIGKYAFSYGGGTAPVIHSFDVSVINNPSVCFVGDSLTEGYGPSAPSKSFAHILRNMDDNSVISAESGNTVNDVMGRFTTEFEHIKPKIIFMLIGANNTSVPSNLFNAMITSCDNIGAKLVLNYIPTGHYVSEINALIDTKNKIGVHFEEISMDSQGNIDTSLFPDSLHPNDAGSKKMAERSVIECPAVFNAS